MIRFCNGAGGYFCKLQVCVCLHVCMCLCGDPIHLQVVVGKPVNVFKYLVTCMSVSVGNACFVPQKDESSKPLLASTSEYSLPKNNLEEKQMPQSMSLEVASSWSDVYMRSLPSSSALQRCAGLAYLTIAKASPLGVRLENMKRAIKVNYDRMHLY